MKLKEYLLGFLISVLLMNCQENRYESRYTNVSFDSEKWQEDKEFRVWMLCEAQKKLARNAFSEAQLLSFLGTPDHRRMNEMSYDIPTGAEYCYWILTLNPSLFLDTMELKCDYSLDEAHLVNCN